MATKKIVPIIYFFLFLSNFVHGQTESERKFVFANYDSIALLIQKNGTLAEFGFQQHATYYYFDIYFETPDKLLQKHQVSLRLRIQFRPGTKDSLNYTFQLKTEMSYPGAPRLEMEERELYYYKLNHHGEEVVLQQVLQNFQEEAKKTSPDFTKHKEIFSTWFKQKAGAPIAPFQGLRFLFPQVFTEQVIGTLMPICYGSTKRTRAHIYLNESLSRYAGVRNKERALNEIPDFFLNQRSVIWLMELSFDQAEFHSIEPNGKTCGFSELEVESKFDETSLKQGNILAFFAETLLQNFKADEEIRSKFKQVMDCLGE